MIEPWGWNGANQFVKPIILDGGESLDIFKATAVAMDMAIHVEAIEG